MAEAEHKVNSGRVMEKLRQPHAVLDLPSRRLKGLKIERLLDLAHRPQPIRMLEIGAGSGGIAHYFGTHPQLRCEVTAVDVMDSRQIAEGYEYHQVDGVDLPFPDAAFDVVLTNHVIEHVGDAEAQARHLAEVRRVMCRTGVGYLAVPNRWMLTEPHFQLKFLSWWPRSLRGPYLRLMRKGTHYDCEPLEMREIERMLRAANLRYKNICIEALRETLKIESKVAMGGRFINAFPDKLLYLMRPLIPTLIYRIERV